MKEFSKVITLREEWNSASPNFMPGLRGLHGAKVKLLHFKGDALFFKSTEEEVITLETRILHPLDGHVFIAGTEFVVCTLLCTFVSRLEFVFINNGSYDNALGQCAFFCFHFTLKKNSVKSINTSQDYPITHTEFKGQEQSLL